MLQTMGERLASVCKIRYTERRECRPIKKEGVEWNIFMKRHWKVQNARVLEIANQAGDTMCRWLDAMIQRME